MYQRNSGREARRLATALVTLGLLISLLAPPAGAADVVRTGFLPFLSFIPLFVAVEKGYFKEQNLELKMSRFIR